MPSTLTKSDRDIITKALNGDLLSPVEMIRLNTLANGGMAENDPDLPVVKSALAKAQVAGAKTGIPTPTPTDTTMRATATPLVPRATNAGGAAPTPTPIPLPQTKTTVATPVMKSARDILMPQGFSGSQTDVGAQEQAADKGAAGPPAASQPDGGTPILGGLGDLRQWLIDHQPTGDFAAGGIQPGSIADQALGAHKPAGTDTPWEVSPENIGINPFGDYDPTTGILDPSKYAGYSFADLTQAQRDMLFQDQSGPALEALALAGQHGGGKATAYGMLPYVDAAMQLAATGAIGGPVSGPGANAGPQSTVEQLKAVEDLINAGAKPGAAYDPQQIMQTVLMRMENTPTDQFSKIAGLGVLPGQAGSASSAASAGNLANPDDQIQATNAAMQAAGTLGLAPQAQKNLAKLLAMTQIQYKQGLLNGSITMSYPEYLDSIGIVGFFREG